MKERDNYKTRVNESRESNPRYPYAFRYRASRGPCDSSFVFFFPLRIQSEKTWNEPISRIVTHLSFFETAKNFNEREKETRDTLEGEQVSTKNTYTKVYTKRAHQDTPVNRENHDRRIFENLKKDPSFSRFSDY